MFCLRLHNQNGSTHTIIFEWGDFNEDLVHANVNEYSVINFILYPICITIQ